MTESTIYWITRLDEIKSLLDAFQTISTIIVAISFLFLAVLLCVRCDEKYRYGTGTRDYMTISIICKYAYMVFIPAFCIAMTSAFAKTFIPTTREMIAIKVIPCIANDESIEKIKDISKDMLDITADWLKNTKKSKK